MASSATLPANSMTVTEAALPDVKLKQRLANIDALRGLVMVLMLLDHLRETWFVNYVVNDPINAATVIPAIGFARFAVSFCAPIFVALTGLGVYLYSINHTVQETSSYLLKRGLLLVVIELIYLSPLYWGIVPQPTFWLQVIWAIGLSMIALAGLMRLPRPALLAFGLVIVCFHNLLDSVRLTSDNPLFPIWAILYQRDVIELPFGLVAKTTYPLLPWLGVISLGYWAGAWFRPDYDAVKRNRNLLVLGFGMIAAFVLLRMLNVYGDKPWFMTEGNSVRSVISFISMTKYPPSLLFLLPTLGGGALLLVLFEKINDSKLVGSLAVFGAAPMFFYLLHLTVLRILYHSALAIYGPNNETFYMFDNYNWVLVWYPFMLVVLYFPTVWYSRLKRRRRDIAWLKYF